MSKNKNWTRVCSDCHHVRYLPKAWAKETAPTGLDIAASKLISLGTGLQGRSGGSRAMQVENARDRVLRNAMCPACGSSNYTQHKPS